MIKDLGKIAYEAWYKGAARVYDFNGEGYNVTTPWEEVDVEVKEIWNETADAVAVEVERAVLEHQEIEAEKRYERGGG